MLETTNFIGYVNLSKLSQVDKFLKIVNKYKDNYTLKHDRYLVDAKSILGIFSLDLDNDIELYADKISLDAATIQFELAEAGILIKK